MTTTTTGTLPVLSQPCCSPVVTGVLEVGEAEQLAQQLKALADPARLRLLSLVAAHEDKEACVCELTEPVGLTQGTVSHHLRVLVEAGLLTREQRGKWAYYAVVTDALDGIAAAISGTQPLPALR